MKERATRQSFCSATIYATPNSIQGHTNVFSFKQLGKCFAAVSVIIDGAKKNRVINLVLNNT